MELLLPLLFILPYITSTYAKDRTHHGCVWTKSGDPKKYCDLRGASYKGVAVKPEFVIQPEGNFTAKEMCEFECADNINCESWSFMTIYSSCQLYSKKVSEIGFEPQRDSKRFYYNRGCTAGQPIRCGKKDKSGSKDDQIFYTGFNDGPGSGVRIIQSSDNNSKGWSIKGPPRCAVNYGDAALFAKAPTNSSIYLTKDLVLDIGKTYQLTFDYVYEDYDPSNIIFGLLYQTDDKGGLDKVFQLARADDADKVDVWQRSRSTFVTARTRKYRIQIYFEFIPGAPVNKRVQWRMDNLCLVRL